MLTCVEIKAFKSIEHVVIEPGVVNVFIGANGSGKSNLLEAIGLLSAAASGRVDDESLLRRGVRPGVPALFKSSFPGLRTPHIALGAKQGLAEYKVTLFHPARAGESVWRFHTESLVEGGRSVASRSHASRQRQRDDYGIAAAEIGKEKAESPAAQLMTNLRDFAIYAPNTPQLRSTVPDSQTRSPVGLSGGRIPEAIREILKLRKKNALARRVSRETLHLIDWAESFGTADASALPLSPSVGATKRLIRFRDRYMRSGNNTLSGFDASEGALYVLFHAALAAHPSSPPVLAVENADHALNPRLCKELLHSLSQWYLKRVPANRGRQIFLTTHNPLVLDGLPLGEDQVRLFAVNRTANGRTAINRIDTGGKLQAIAKKKDWPLSRLWVMGYLGGVPNV